MTSNNPYHPEHDRFDAFVKADPTYRFFLREARIDSKLFDQQVDIMFAVARVALREFINRKY